MVSKPNVQYIFLIFMRQTLSKKLQWLFLQKSLKSLLYMRKLFLYILLLSVTTISFGQLKSGYDIDITIKDLPDSTLFLAFHLGDKQYIKDTIRLDQAGHGILQGQELLPQGIYMIVLPGKKYFEFLITDKQRFSISCLFSDYFHTLKFTGSQENSAFVDYQKKWVALQQQASALSKRIQNNRQNRDSLKILGADPEGTGRKYEIVP